MDSGDSDGGPISDFIEVGGGWSTISLSPIFWRFYLASKFAPWRTVRTIRR